MLHVFHGGTRLVITERCQVAVVGSGFSGSLMARILSTLGFNVMLLERGTHPRFAIGESTTPLANLSLERVARRYGLADGYHLAAHGRWMKHHPRIGRGIKRGFTFYRHHAGGATDDGRLRRDRLLVAANPTEAVADTHWVRADVDHHFVKEAIASGVDYRDRVRIADATFDADGVTIRGSRDNIDFHLCADFVIDASGPAGFAAQFAGIPSALDQTLTRSGVLFSHFTNVGLASDRFPNLPDGPYPDDWAAVHHIIDEGWMYSLRFDHGVTSAGFVIQPTSAPSGSPDAMWQYLLARYPTIAALFAGAEPEFPVAYRPLIQHRLSRAARDRWLLLPHAYAFVDPLFSTGIAWTLRAIERIALAFESSKIPSADFLERYDTMLGAEADQIDCVVAGAYEAMRDFDLFAAHAMIYFTAVSFAEVTQRLHSPDSTDAAWSGFLGVDDPVLDPLPRESLARLRTMSKDDYVAWVQSAIAPRNIGGFGDPARNRMYPVDLDILVDRHALLGMTRDDLIDALPALRGVSPRPGFLQDSRTTHTFAS